MQQKFISGYKFIHIHFIFLYSPKFFQGFGYHVTSWMVYPEYKILPPENSASPVLHFQHLFL